MARFWLATFELLPSPPADVSPAAAPILATGSPNVAIEVVGDPARGEYAVLLSTVDHPERPSAMTCRLGFTNVAKPCSVWRDRGIPLIDARIVSGPNGTLEVFSPYFGDDPAMQYESLLFAVTGISFEPNGTATKLETLYRQALEAPDGAQPATVVVQRPVVWAPQRSDTKRLPSPAVKLTVTHTRYPSLAPLVSGVPKLVGAWSGDLYLPADQGEQNRGRPLSRVNRADFFGAPAFRFDDVEVLGFRIDLAAYGRDFRRDLDRLIAPLNFHLQGGADAVWDFRYRAATPTLLIELLRYGSMKLKTPSPPVAAADYQSQHELLVRLLVGRVDDDTAQAHSPATYVPAIFVDNPWSKVLGRDLQGFDKRLAHFHVLQDGRPVPLLPDGRVAQEGPASMAAAPDQRSPRPLGDISLVTLVDTAGPRRGPTVLELECSPAKYPDWNAFQAIDLGLALSSFSLAGTRWRQSDFEEAEFRRSFARSAVTDSLQGVRSIQASPIGDRGLERTWITGTFTVDDGLRIASPSGVASLTLHAVPPNANAPTAPSSGTYWNLLCEMLGDGTRAKVSLPTGSWYRLLCSMDFTIDDGLD